MIQKTAMILVWMILLELTLVVPAFSSAIPEGWKALRANLHINEKTLTRIDRNTVSAWIYLAPRKGSDSYNAAKQQLRAMKKNSSDLEYIGYLSEIDCVQSRYRKITTVFFKKDRNIIASRHRLHPEWQEIDEDSMFDDVYQAVCEKEKMAISIDPKRN